MITFSGAAMGIAWGLAFSLVLANSWKASGAFFILGCLFAVSFIASLIRESNEG